MCKSPYPPKFEAIEGLYDVAYTNMGMIDTCTFLLDSMITRKILAFRIT